MNNLLFALAISLHVLNWFPEVQSLEKVAPEVMLTLIHMESTGDCEARRPNSRYHGLLQISDAYMEDALVYAGREVEPASELMGDGEYSIQIFEWYMERYSFLHQWDEERIALLHKSGPVAFQRILDRMDSENLEWTEAVCADPTPGICAYLSHYRSVKSIYAHVQSEIDI